MNDSDSKTEFNAALASLLRLHQLLVDCNEYRITSFDNGYNLQSIKRWKFTLDAIYSEMYPKIRKSDSYQKFEKLFSLYAKTKRLLETNKINDEEVSTLNVNAFYALYKINDKIEKELRFFADAKGMLIPEKGSIYDDLNDI